MTAVRNLVLQLVYAALVVWALVLWTKREADSFSLLALIVSGIVLILLYEWFHMKVGQYIATTTLGTIAFLLLVFVSRKLIVIVSIYIAAFIVWLPMTILSLLWKLVCAII